jgi:predicted AAA+ superfamily ATPase
VSQYLALDGRIDHFDRSFFDDLYGAYLEDMGKYVRSGAESLKIERIFSSIPTQLNNSSARFQYSKAGKGARSLHYASALDWLLAAGLAHKAMAVSLPEKPLAYFADADVFKLFVHDVGMLTHRMGIAFGDLVLDSIGQAKGMVAESYVACEMVSKGRQLRYWRSANNAEVDLLLECQDGVIPVEVKSADNVRSKSLKAYCDKYKPAYAFRVSAKNFGMEGGIRSVPLYASFCLGGLN